MVPPSGSWGWSWGRFSSGYLERVSWYGPLGFEGSHHFPDLVEARLVDVRSFQSFLHVEEAVPAGQVTTVGDDDVREASVAEVVGAQSAVCGACAAFDRDVRCVGSFAVRPVGREFLIHVVRAEVELFCLTVFWAGLGHEDLALPLEDGAW